VDNYLRVDLRHLPYAGGGAGDVFVVGAIPFLGESQDGGEFAFVSLKLK
jgi:hypothetical protein